MRWEAESDNRPTRLAGWRTKVSDTEITKWITDGNGYDSILPELPEGG